MEPEEPGCATVGCEVSAPPLSWVTSAHETIPATLANQTSADAPTGLWFLTGVRSEFVIDKARIAIGRLRGGVQRLNAAMRPRRRSGTIIGACLRALLAMRSAFLGKFFAMTAADDRHVARGEGADQQRDETP